MGEPTPDGVHALELTDISEHIEIERAMDVEGPIAVTSEESSCTQACASAGCGTRASFKLVNARDFKLKLQGQAFGADTGDGTGRFRRLSSYDCSALRSTRRD